MSKVSKNQFLIFLFLIYQFIALPANVLSKETIVYGFDNLPLIDGLNQIDDKCFLFDTPYGRIIHAFAIGKLDRIKVASFYNTTLTQLGWREVEQMKFYRDGEYLRVEVESLEDKNIGVYFLLRPSQNK